MAPLYHGTPLDAAVDILNSGYLIPSKSHHQFQLLMQKPGTASSRVSGISMSRNFNTSAKWGEDGVVLVFDQQKLNQRYRIIPIHKNIRGERTHNTFRQFEEYVVSDKNIPLRGVLIDVRPAKWNTDASIIAKFKEKFNLNNHN